MEEFQRLLEPFQRPDKIEDYKRRLGMQTAIFNLTGKIWLFVEDLFEVKVLVDHEQHITIKLNSNGQQEEIVISIVYAKCTNRERLDLWGSLEDFASQMHKPLIMAGDFNVIMSEDEKYGGLAVGTNEIQDFKLSMQNCEVQDLSFKGSRYTWWNGKSGDDRIFKRLDRCLGNFRLQQMFPEIEVYHLTKTSSDHAPLLVSYTRNNDLIKKPFKFLNFWVKNDTFMEIKASLVQWSSDTFGNIFQEIETLENVIKVHEIQFELQPTPHNREKLHRV
ncbi:uncharacterized protein LOC132637569 [Lycium barbarum]|uniref:uncharacterized protein LOC132637569 n=1 Tax=Lycium barbarum TaxID=112863 RepID=UPI00293F673C|nr:uncharacterized protein LOC132637569 [Lycium barbarum]